MSKSKPKRHAVSRRMLLQGAGVAMALPWLESLPVWGTELANDAADVEFPKRFAALFMACGVHPEHWWAKGDGQDMRLSKSLLPLEPIKHKVNVINGLFNKNATGVGIHPGQTGNILSGAALQKGAELRGGVSIDQLLANQLGSQTAQASIVLGCEQPITGYHETNFSMAYSSHISWRNATSPVPMEVYPSLAFDSLFDTMDRQKEEAEATFEREVKAHEDRERLLSEKFEEALRRAKEDPDEEPIPRPFDLD